jgi:non-ribosomal peptide synthetase component F
MERLTSAVKRYNVTLAVLTKAAWALTLKAYLQTDDVVFGYVDSGREMAIEGIERYGLLI